MEDSKVKAIIEGIISIIDENTHFFGDDRNKECFIMAVNHFNNGYIDFSTFVSKCLAQGLITGKHWNQELYDITDGLLISDLNKLHITFPW